MSEVGTCPYVTGTFQNRGEREDPRYPPNLAWQLFAHRAAWQDADRVDIRLLDPNTLSIRILSGGRVLNDNTLVREKQEFSCEGGFLAIPKDRFINREGVLASENATVFLALSGSTLIVKENTTALGIMFFVPAAGSSTTWSRYQPAK